MYQCLPYMSRTLTSSCGVSGGVTLNTGALGGGAGPNPCPLALVSLLGFFAALSPEPFALLLPLLLALFLPGFLLPPLPPPLPPRLSLGLAQGDLPAAQSAAAQMDHVTHVQWHEVGSSDGCPTHARW